MEFAVEGVRSIWRLRFVRSVNTKMDGKYMNLENIKIAVCDDMEIICKDLIRVINGVLEREQIMGEVEYFISGCDLLKQIERFDITFLDMDMQDMDGIDVGIEIEKRNPECKIIIASSREDRFKETYRIHPLRFISKPFDKEEVWDAIQAYQIQQIGYTEMEMFRERKSYKFPQRNIQYIASYKGGVEIIVDKEVYHKDISLNQIEHLLEKKLFVRVHKSYIVNMFRIKEIEEHRIKVGNIWIPVSRRQVREFRELYMEFDIKYR